MPRKVKRSHQRNKSKRINVRRKRIRKRKLSSKRKRKSKNMRNRKRKSMQRGGANLVEEIKSTLLGLDGSEMAKGILKALFNTEKKNSLKPLQSLWARHIEFAARRGVHGTEEDRLLQLEEGSRGKLRLLPPDDKIIDDLESIYKEVNKGGKFPILNLALPKSVDHRETCIVMIVYLWCIFYCICYTVFRINKHL